ncbi:unnamed protein product [Durusdinium trenchii]
MNRSRWDLVWSRYVPPLDFSKPSSDSAFHYLDADADDSISKQEFESLFKLCHNTPTSSTFRSTSSAPTSPTTSSRITTMTTLSTSTLTTFTTPVSSTTLLSSTALTTRTTSSGSSSWTSLASTTTSSRLSQLTTISTRTATSTYASAVVLPAKHVHTHCCYEVSAQCLSCIAGITVEELCSRDSMSLTPGCQGAPVVIAQAAPGGPHANAEVSTTLPPHYKEVREDPTNHVG